MLTSEQKIIAAISHGSVFVGLPVIVPLIIMLVSTDEFVRTQAKEALIFHIGWVIGMAVSIILVILLVGIIGIIIVGICGLILPIIAIINVLEGRDYSYPITGKFARTV